MPRKRQPDPICDSCGRHLNEWRDLTDMFSRHKAAQDPYRQAPAVLRICGSSGCWTDAHQRGFFSSHETDRSS